MDDRRAAGALSAGGPQPSAAGDSSRIWRPEGVRAAFRRPLPHRSHSWAERFACRAITALSERWILEIRGLEHIQPERDPFVLVMNHSQRPEAILLPVVMIGLRAGKSLHFIGDWNFQLIPGVGFLFRRSGLITVVRKSAKPRFLNAFKRFYAHPLTATERSLLILQAGGSLGIFPEGTVNRDPERLLPGRQGAARLSVEAQVPVVPGGIRFPEKDPGEPIRDGDRMILELGPPMAPPPDDGSREVVASWHHRVMRALSALSAKSWGPARERS